MSTITEEQANEILELQSECLHCRSTDSNFITHEGGQHGYIFCGTCSACGPAIELASIEGSQAEDEIKALKAWAARPARKEIATSRETARDTTSYLFNTIQSGYRVIERSGEGAIRVFIRAFQGTWSVANSGEPLDPKLSQKLNDLCRSENAIA